MKKIIKSLAALLLVSSAINAHAALFTNSYGNILPGYTKNDDNTFGAQNLGFSLNLFGTDYSSFYISNNGLLSFGHAISSYSPTPLNQETDGVIIAPYWTDLDTFSNSAADAGIYLSQTANQTIVTWNKMGYYPENYSGTATFQVVLNSNGQIGFYYGNMASGTDGHNAAAGFGDGLASINEGELSSASGTTGVVSSRLNQTQLAFSVAAGGVPQVVPEPATLALLGLGLFGFAAARRRKNNS